MTKTRAEHARDYLSAKLVDRDTNFGMNEAYRTAMDEMVAYIDLPHGCDKCGHRAATSEEVCTGDCLEDTESWEPERI